MSVKKVLITGAAGFIASSLIQKILSEPFLYEIVGVDNLNDYYDVDLKKYRLDYIKNIKSTSKFIFVKGDISDKIFVEKLFNEYKFDVVINLAAQAGVRYSISNPDSYISSNIVGFYNILEACRHYPPEHLIFASSSSVYGSNEKIPFSTEDKTDCPVSLYAATKKADELFAYSYSKLYGIPTTGLRFFTVYGPAGRPDMAYFSFTNILVNNETINIFNYGNCKRDFTYIDDVTDAIFRVINKKTQNLEDENGTKAVPYKIYNVGNSHPVNLMDFVRILTDELIKANVLPEDFDIEKHINLIEKQPGDVETTYADVTDFERDFKFKPSTELRNGLRKFSEWYYSFYLKK